MRRVFLFLLLVSFCAPAQAADPGESKTRSPEAALRWIKNYRTKPDPTSVPEVFRMLSERGAFKDPETSGVYVGFLAGVIGANPKTAKSLIAKTLPLPFEDQWVMIRAVAYSNHPRWRELMLDLITRLPDRRLLIEHYLSGEYSTLETIPLEPEKASALDKMRRIFKRETYFGKKEKRPDPITFVSNPELIDVHWGIYFATGKAEAIERIVVLLPWSTERDDVEKLTAGGMAKFTLAANASRDVHLLRMLKGISAKQSKAVRPILQEVTEAAETADTGRIRKEAVAVVDEIRRKGPGSKREIAWWGQVGQTTLALGCMGAALTGQVEFGIPCVVGGALSGAAIRYLASPEDG
jgi:hypothetical protein